MDLLSLGEFLTIGMLALAVGMDAFSLGIGVGMGGIRLKHVLKISLAIGLFHILMPFAGIVLGLFFSQLVGQWTKLVGGGILVCLGANMLFASIYSSKPIVSVPDHGLKFLLFVFSVSIDALSIGFTLGLFSSATYWTLGLFGFSGCLMSMGGLLLGRKVGGWIGHYGEAFGGMILLLIGLKLIF